MTNQNFKTSKNEPIFQLVKDENGKVLIVCAGYKASTKTFDNFKQADQYIGTKPYELIFNTFAIMLKIKEENEKETKENA